MRRAHGFRVVTPPNPPTKRKKKKLPQKMKDQGLWGFRAQRLQTTGLRGLGAGRACFSQVLMAAEKLTMLGSLVEG